MQWDWHNTEGKMLIPDLSESFISGGLELVWRDNRALVIQVASFFDDFSIHVVEEEAEDRLESIQPRGLLVLIERVLQSYLLEQYKKSFFWDVNSIAWDILRYSFLLSAL